MRALPVSVSHATNTHFFPSVVSDVDHILAFVHPLVLVVGGLSCRQRPIAIVHEPVEVPVAVEVINKLSRGASHRLVLDHRDLGPTLFDGETYNLISRCFSEGLLVDSEHLWSPVSVRFRTYNTHFFPENICDLDHILSPHNKKGPKVETRGAL